MGMLVSLSEFGIIRPSHSAVAATFSEAHISHSSFSHLKQLAFAPGADAMLTYSVRQKNEQIQVKNYVGTIELKDGTQIEILPKTNFDSRQLLLNMLRTLRNTPFKSIGRAHVGSAPQSVKELFIGAFLTEIENIVGQQLGKNYQTQLQNESYLRGKWLINKQLKSGALSRDRFWAETDVFSVDTAANRLLKSCLVFVDQRSTLGSNKKRITRLRHLLDNVPESYNLPRDFKETQRLSRGFERYRVALSWADIFLKNKSFSPFAGIDHNFALLFPMQQLFEDYVTHSLLKNLSNCQVTRQDRRHFLVENHLDQRLFGLRPDVVIETATQTIVVDIKWKTLKARNQAGHYGIEQTDLYQLFAYGKKYAADALYLLYPANPDFVERLPPFSYENQAMFLHVVPYDLAASGAENVRKIFPDLC